MVMRCCSHGWTEGLVTFLSKQLESQTLAPEQSELVSNALLAAIGNPPVQELISRTLEDANAPVDTRLLLLNVISHSRLKKLTSTWRTPLDKCLLAHEE